MNEFELAEQQSELEILKKTQPRWSLAVPEPFARSAQQDVSLPTWDKVKFPDMIASGSTNSGSVPSFTAIVANNGVPWYASVNGSLTGQVSL
jgi:hypothetical protein